MGKWRLPEVTGKQRINEQIRVTPVRRGGVAVILDCEAEMPLVFLARMFHDVLARAEQFHHRQ